MSEGPPPALESSDEQSAAVPWYRRRWVVAAIVLVAAVGLAAIVGDDPSTDGPEVASSESDEPEPTDTPTDPTPTASTEQPSTEETSTDPEAAPTGTAPTGAEPTGTGEPTPSGTTEPEQTGTTEPEPAFGAGAQVVGEDVRPGTYRSGRGSSECYWERVSGVSGGFAEIVANGNLTPEIVTIDDADTGFSSEGCGDWFLLEDTLPSVPATAFGDGTFTVGGHVEPGTYVSDGTGDGPCYWERRSGFSGEFGDIVANGSTPTVEISSSDAGFTSSGCGRWTRGG